MDEARLHWGTVPHPDLQGEIPELTPKGLAACVEGRGAVSHNLLTRGASPTVTAKARRAHFAEGETEAQEASRGEEGRDRTESRQPGQSFAECGRRASSTEPPDGGWRVAAPLCPRRTPARHPTGCHRPARVHSPVRWRSGREGHLWGLQGGAPWWSEAGSARGPGPASGPGPAEESLATARSRSARGPYLGIKETWRQETCPPPKAGDGADPITGEAGGSEKKGEAVRHAVSKHETHFPVETASKTGKHTRFSPRDSSSR